MIILGYPGIGKTTFCLLKKDPLKYIDLDSSSFHNSKDKRDDVGWEKRYIDRVLELDSQDRIIFISTHEIVQEELKNRRDTEGLDIVKIYPSKDIELEWVKKLRRRYLKSEDDKDRRAYEYIKNNYEKTIIRLELEMPYHSIVLCSDNYKLDKEIGWFMEELECFKRIRSEKLIYKVRVRGEKRVGEVLLKYKLRVEGGDTSLFRD